MSDSTVCNCLDMFGTSRSHVCKRGLVACMYMISNDFYRHTRLHRSVQTSTRLLETEPSNPLRGAQVDSSLCAGVGGAAEFNANRARCWAGM